MHETSNTGRLLWRFILNPALKTDPGNHLVPMNVALSEEHVYQTYKSAPRSISKEVNMRAIPGELLSDLVSINR